ncbi:hypothetical protein Tco_0772306 [Tanacetum coccineum]|uniref:Uncharacterized protein n=1 Tax=Tanacetum coccineum TaxID=301880 RepID=A0ABQ4ZHS3_9ASTR
MLINAAFLTDDLDAFDSDYNEAPSARVVLMANLSGYDSDVISEVPISEPYQDNYVLDHCVQEMYYSEQPAFDHTSDIEIMSDSNIISYDQYMKENESEVVQNTNSPEQQNAMMMFVIDEMSNQVAKCNAVNLENKIVNESLTAELERYKEQIKMSNDRDNHLDFLSKLLFESENAQLPWDDLDLPRLYYIRKGILSRVFSSINR